MPTGTGLNSEILVRSLIMGTPLSLRPVTHVIEPGVSGDANPSVQRV